MNSRNLRPFKPLMLFYRLRTLRKSRWRPSPTWMILWWRTSRRQRITQRIPLPLLSSPPLRARYNPLWMARFRVSPSPRISLSWAPHLLTVVHSLGDRKSNSSGLAPSVRKEFGRQNLAGPYHKQSECPSADHSRRQPKGPVCFEFKWLYRMFLSLPAPVPPLPFRQPLYPHLLRQYFKGQLKAPPEFQLPRPWQTIKCCY